ncbi:pentatricopeptide repeat-containing protein At1g74630-like [Solanum pennellii]|uniref:Pentatricopeptide repeat-containing protein At1g74630-like n=1 Tax=Solanum pennellii TaxID=28526 RepID=A0ABM1H766_SOLPN|nr:pentatricopeptide repeat-containing protein At1g74630-like [Solanum pennellii]
MSRAEKVCLSLLSYCKTLGNLNQIHAFVYKSGLETNPLIAGKLLILGALQISDAIDYARRLLIHYPNSDVFMYNTLIRGESESDSPKNSVSTFIYMLRQSYSPPDSFSFAFVLKAAANLRCLTTGFQLHCQAMTRGLDTHLFVGTTIISMYAECGFVEFAWKVFVQIPQPNVVAWNAILTAYLRGSDVSGADKVFGLMPFRNLTTWNVMLAGYTKAGELERAEGLFLQMPSRDDISWSTILNGTKTRSSLRMWALKIDRRADPSKQAPLDNVRRSTAKAEERLESKIVQHTERKIAEVHPRLDSFELRVLAQPAP